MSYNYEVIRGSDIRGEQLRLSRAISILKAVKLLPHTTLISCRRKPDESEIIIFNLSRLGIPDEPAFDIHDNEDIAIICTKDDIEAPMVFALRSDFPTGLPHSNAMKFEHPVSLCISDVSFNDYRQQFSSIDFLSYIKRWLYLNSLNKLHEVDRPLEVFFATKKVCTQKRLFRSSYNYARLEKITDFSYTIDPVEDNKATHFIVWIQTSVEISRSFAAMPNTIGDLNCYKDFIGNPLLLSILRSLSIASSQNTFQTLVGLFVEQHRENCTTDKSFNLFLIKIDCAVCDINNNKKRLSEINFFNWFKALPIDILFLLPPVNITNNIYANGLSNQLNKIVFLGVGTLGSNILDTLVREGYSKEIALVDYDLLYPHNIARHILPASNTMQYKVKALKNYLGEIEGQKIIIRNHNYLALDDVSKKYIFDNADLVIDASTSIAAERKLAFDDSIDEMRRCTIFLNPQGTDLVFIMEDKTRKQRLDLLEMSYMRAILTLPEMAFHLEVNDALPINDFSCRTASGIINYDNICMLAAVASQQIKKSYEEDTSFLNVWRVNTVDSLVSKISIKKQNWDKYYIDNIDIYVAEDICSEIDKQKNTTNETGGCLFGCYDKDRRIIYIIYAYPAPKDSICTPCSFIRGCDGLKTRVEEIDKKSFHQVRYLGEWHSHPNTSKDPSITDLNQFNEMSSLLIKEDLPFVQIISGINGLYVNATM
jgi:integrative and conjugative element protein (TIGR02256 family)